MRRGRKIKKLLDLDKREKKRKSCGIKNCFYK